MRKLSIILATLFAALLSVACAQGVTRERVTTQDLLRLFDAAVAIEVTIPPGATVYTVSFGTVEDSSTYSTFLPGTVGARDPARLRVVTLLPEGAGGATCAPNGAEGTVMVSVTNDSDLENYTKEGVCVTLPPAAGSVGSVQRVLDEGIPELDRWTPILFYASLIETSGGVDKPHAAIEVQHAFWVQVGFLAGNRTDFPSRPPLGIEELSALPEVAGLLEEYGLPAGR